MKLSAVRQKRYYDVRADESPYKPGDLVWVMNQVKRKGKCPKKQMRWIGPLILIKPLNNITYFIKTS